MKIQFVKVLRVLLVHIWGHKQNSSLDFRRKHIYISLFYHLFSTRKNYEKLKVLLLSYVKFWKSVTTSGEQVGKSLFVCSIQTDGYLMTSDLHCTGGLKLEQM